MTKTLKKPFTKKIWLIETLTENNQSNRHVVIATSKKDCKSILEELILEETFTYTSINYVGNVASSSEYFKTWNGESLLLTTNYY